MIDVISIGDVRIDNYLELLEGRVQISPNGEKRELCLGYGDKIPVGLVKQFIAGNNANNAVGLSRLGLKVAIYGNIGGDDSAKKILAYLKKEGVQTNFLKINEGKDTEASTILSFQGDRTILVFHQPWDYDLPELERTKWVYFSSVSFSFTKTNLIPQIVNFLERTGAKLMFAPGTHVLAAGVKKYPRLLSLTDVLVVNLEEAKKILQIDEGRKVDVKHLLSHLKDLGPSSVVITDGKNGSFALTAERFFKMGIFPSKLVQMTGAGDAFGAGLLAGLIHKESIEEAMRWGTANSAAVIEQVGAQTGLLEFTQLQEKLKNNVKIVSKEI